MTVAVLMVWHQLCIEVIRKQDNVQTLVPQLQGPSGRNIGIGAVPIYAPPIESIG